MKTTLQIMYWRDIPAQVKAQAGRQRASRPLSARFQEAIDAAAMISGATGSDAYLEDWRAGDPQESELELEAAAEALAAQLEHDYPLERLRVLALNQGRG